MSGPGRRDGFADLADYAVLGDGRTAALVARDGQLDWWPFPTLDSPPVCAALLDPRDGGHVLVAPDGPFQVTRRYLPGSNVVEAEYTTPTGTVRVTTSLNYGSAGRLPWTELAYRIEGLDGAVPMRWEVAAGDRFGRVTPWARMRGDVAVISVGDQNLAVLVAGGEPGRAARTAVSGQLRLTAGECVVVAVVATDNAPLPLPTGEDIDRRLTRTVEASRRWTSTLDNDGDWAEDVERSALALRALLCEDSGAIAAATTTSLPESLGGAKNWDYRYAWVRDTSFTLDALLNLGLREEVQGAVAWLLGAVRRHGPDIHVFYRLDGSLPLASSELDAPGYRDSRPVREGNGAATQIQLGTYGDLMDTMWRYLHLGHLLDQTTGRLLADLADRCCDRWTSKDSGIWELEQLEHYTISKIGCWVALDRAVALADLGQIPADRRDRWAQEADAVKRWVHEHCWSQAQQSFTFYAGTEQLDAAVLLAARTGFERGPRLASTVRAVADELADGALLYRYSGMRKDEGAFVACGFWMVEALAHTGQLEPARALMDQLVGMTNDVGLFSEEIDPSTGAFLGNLPQGLSHLSLINAAYTLRRAGRHGATLPSVECAARA